MDRIRIRGGRPLAGDIVIGGAKNAALPLMAISPDSGLPPRMRIRSIRYIRGSATPRWPIYLPALSA